jgi:hypothetical protein
MGFDFRLVGGCYDARIFIFRDAMAAACLYLVMRIDRRNSPAISSTLIPAKYLRVITAARSVGSLRIAVIMSSPFGPLTSATCSMIACGR